MQTDRDKGPLEEYKKKNLHTCSNILPQATAMSPSNPT